MLWTERPISTMDFTEPRHHVMDVFSSADVFQPTNDISLLSNYTSNSANNMQSVAIGNNRSCHHSNNGSVTTSRSRSASGDNNSTSGSGSSKSERYKTEMCRTFSENGSCRYGDKCQFAHGLAELRTVSRHPKYKTDLCRTFHSTGFCPYGTRCHFIHAMNESTMSVEEAPSQQQAFIRPGSFLGLTTPRKLSTEIANDAFPVASRKPFSPTPAVPPTTDLNTNVLAYLLRAMELNQVPAPNQIRANMHPPQFSALHPMSPTHSLDSITYSSSSNHSLSPCPSPTDDVFSFPMSFHHQTQHPLSPASPPMSADNSNHVWPRSLLTDSTVSSPLDDRQLAAAFACRPFSSFAQSSNHCIFA